VKYKGILLLILILTATNSYSRESFEFSLGQKVNILSDKAFRKTKENEFEAVGNVVITHLKNSIYGEKARLNFSSGEVEIEGNVRYISPTLTLYGSKLSYNFITKNINFSNARILSDNFVVIGKSIIQNRPDVIEAVDAEYTTCKDCPESWSIYGKKVNISIGKYVKIKNAYVKAKGVIVMFLPYVVFPIKEKRESGVLFPSIGYKNDEGFKYQQPFFWAINDFSDLTFSPAVFGKRGFGNQLQYRHNLFANTWTEFNTLMINDEIYVPKKVTKDKSGKKEFRYFSDIELHSGYKEFLNGHIYFNNSSDLDTKRDFGFFSNDKIQGTEFGGGGFGELNFDFLSLNLEAYKMQNLLFSEPDKLDKSYVQLLPKISLKTVPLSLLSSDILMMKNITFGIESDFTIFGQNQSRGSSVIRDAKRTNLMPYLNWEFGSIGPVNLATNIKLDQQYYNFPKENDKKFSKRGIIYESELKFELEKIYGLAYIDKEVKHLNESNKTDSSLVGQLPSYSENVEKEYELKFKNSYRHAQEYIMKHYYLTDQKIKGNQRFYNQIQNDSGQFDYIDSIRAKEHVSNQTTAQDSLPLSNTIEFQWNNFLIRKESRTFDPYVDGKYLKDNFVYKNLSYFNVSQGIDLNISNNKFSDKLTRLYLNTGLELDSLAFNLKESYFHRTSEHKLNSELLYKFDQSEIGSKFTYNAFNSSSTPITKLLGALFNFKINDLFYFKSSMDYNIVTKLFSQSDFSLLYSPLNNCWRSELTYHKDLIEKKIGFVFYFNFNDNNFSAINVR